MHFLNRDFSLMTYSDPISIWDLYHSLWVLENVLLLLHKTATHKSHKHYFLTSWKPVSFYFTPGTCINLLSQVWLKEWKKELWEGGKASIFFICHDLRWCHSPRVFLQQPLISNCTFEKTFSFLLCCSNNKLVTFFLILREEYLRQTWGKHRTFEKKGIHCSNWNFMHNFWILACMTMN